MTKLNHNRPHLKSVDNIKREISEIESWHKSEKNISSSIHAKKKVVAAASNGTDRKKPVMTMDKKIHLLACSILAHIEQHRATGINADLANALVNSLPTGIRKNALLEWFCTHGALSYNVELKKLQFDKAQTTRQAAGEAKPFWEFKPETECKAFDLDKSIGDLVRRALKRKSEIDAAKAIDASFTSDDKISENHLKVLQTLVTP